MIRVRWEGRPGGEGQRVPFKIVVKKILALIVWILFFCIVDKITVTHAVCVREGGRRGGGWKG